MKSRTIGRAVEKVLWSAVFLAVSALFGCGEKPLAPEAECADAHWMVVPDAGGCRPSECSLVDALSEAKKCPTLAFTLEMGPGAYIFEKASEEASGPAALPEIVGAVSIRGAEGVRIEAKADSEASVFRLFNVSSGGSLELSRLTLSGGRADLGGSIYSRGHLRLIDVDIEKGLAVEAGGGIYSSGELSVRGGQFRANRAGGSSPGVGPGRGGAVFVAPGSLARFARVNFLENQAGEGAGLFVGGLTELVESSMRLNRSQQGGGAFVARGPLVVRRSTLFENEARLVGGGLAIGPGGAGTLETSTLSNNTSFGSGGGVSVEGQLDLVGSTIFGNWARPGSEGGGLFAGTDSALSARASVVAGSRSGGDCRVTGAVRTTGHNLSGDGSCPGFEVAEDADYLVRDLADNGGPTWTHLPWDGSPMLDSRIEDCQEPDQRGLPRGDDGDGDGRRGCDLGATELRDSERR